MTTARTVQHPPHLLALKLATRRAVEAAGGQDLVARETGRSQGRISDYCNLNTPDFMPLDVAATVDALGCGRTAQPVIASALTRVNGIVDSTATMTMRQHLVTIAAESSDLIRQMALRLDENPATPSGTCATRDLLNDADDLAECIARLVADVLGGAGQSGNSANSAASGGAYD